MICQSRLLPRRCRLGRNGDKANETTDFSRRDREYVEELILEICERIGLNMRNAGLRDICLNTGWESFLQVYREQPESFRGSGWRGWDSAAKRIREKQLQVKRALDFARYGQVSLNQPARDESTSPRIE